MNEIFSGIDNLWGAIYFLIFTPLIYKYGVKKMTNPKLKGFFLISLLLRLFSAFIYIFLYMVILGGVTDTGRYYNFSLESRAEILSGTFVLNMDMITDSMYTTSTIAAFFGLLTPGNYLCISYIFTILGFIGSWKIYKIFIDLYPKLYSKLAYSSIYLPSFVFWGSGLLKDPVALFGLGLLFSGAYYIFIKHIISRGHILNIIIGLIFCGLTKVYIPIIFIASFFVWVFLTFIQKAKNIFIRIIVFPLLMLLIVGVGAFAVSQLTNLNKSFSVEKSGNTMKELQDFYANNPEYIGGSQYDVGTISPNMIDNIKIMPNAFFITYFRPFIGK